MAVGARAEPVLNEFPSISIVTPSFNQAAFVEQTIRSVLDQGYPKLEYRVMDGGSTDGSADIVRRFDERLAGWISEPDGGQADAIGRGFGQCSGEILAYLNSDDTYLPGTLEAVGRAFAAHPDVDLIYGDLVFVSASGAPLVIDVLPRFDAADLRRVCVIPQPAAFWRRSIYDRAGGIDPEFKFALDYDLFLRMLDAGGRMMHLPRLLAEFRHHGEAKTSRMVDQWSAEDRLLRKRSLGREQWNAGDRARLKWLTVRQITTIARRRLGGEPLPCMTPARWRRLAARRLGRG